jgi:hypothetical protein
MLLEVRAAGTAFREFDPDEVSILIRPWPAAAGPSDLDAVADEMVALSGAGAGAGSRDPCAAPAPAPAAGEVRVVVPGGRAATVGGLRSAAAAALGLSVDATAALVLIGLGGPGRAGPGKIEAGDGDLLEAAGVWTGDVTAVVPAAAGPEAAAAAAAAAERARFGVVVSFVVADELARAEPAAAAARPSEPLPAGEVGPAGEPEAGGCEAVVGGAASASASGSAVVEWRELRADTRWTVGRLRAAVAAAAGLPAAAAEGTHLRRGGPRGPALGEELTVEGAGLGGGAGRVVLVRGAALPAGRVEVKLFLLEVRRGGRAFVWGGAGYARRCAGGGGGVCARTHTSVSRI